MDVFAWLGVALLVVSVAVVWVVNRPAPDVDPKVAKDFARASAERAKQALAAVRQTPARHCLAFASADIRLETELETPPATRNR